jgi:hypothetical protein
MKRNYFVLLLFFICTTTVLSQDKTLQIRLSNNITGLPVSSYPDLFTSNFHPGIDVGLSYPLNENPKHQISASGNIGFFYHRFIQTGIKLYPSFDYTFVPNTKWNFFFSLDLGYLLAFENVDVFELQENGNYEAAALLKARSQFMFGYRIGASFKPGNLEEGIRYLLSFGTFLQGPYVSGYVPLLPYNSFTVGVELPFPLKKQS